MKSIRNLALVPALALAAFGARATEPIKIGQVVTVTGSNAPWGIPENNAPRTRWRASTPPAESWAARSLIDYDYKGDQLEAVNVTKRLSATASAPSSGPVPAALHRHDRRD